MTKIYKRLDPVDPGAGCDLDPVNHWFSGSRRWVRSESSESLDPESGCCSESSE